MTPPFMKYANDCRAGSSRACDQSETVYGFTPLAKGSQRSQTGTSKLLQRGSMDRARTAKSNFNPEAQKLRTSVKGMFNNFLQNVQEESLTGQGAAT